MVQKITTLEERHMTLTETIARITLLEEQRAQQDQKRDDQIKKVMEQLATPPASQVRLVELLEDQKKDAEARAREAERQRERALEKERDDNNKSDKWMREIILMLISALVGGGLINAGFKKSQDAIDFVPALSSPAPEMTPTPYSPTPDP